VLGREENSSGQSRESKRKIPAFREIEKARILNAIQSISNKPLGRAQLPSNQSPGLYEVNKTKNGPKLDHTPGKPTRHASVKDKRALARMKVAKTHSKGADVNGKTLSSSSVQTHFRPVQTHFRPVQAVNHQKTSGGELSGGELSQREASNFRFGEARWTEGVYHFEGHSRGEF